MKQILLALVIGLLSLPAFASRNHTQCFLPADQGLGSLAGSWENLPITLVFDSEFYTADGGRVAHQLKKAVNTWNRWAALKGKVAFVIADEGKGREIPQLTGCSQPEYSQEGFVGVWKISEDGWHKNQRPSCATQANGLPGKLMPRGVQESTDWIILNGKIRGGSVILNFDEFNRPGGVFVDMESVFLHSLGHVLGLLHSCNGSTGDSVDSTSAPACYGNTPRDYLNAVMFPFLEVGQLRRQLGQNDLDRVNCLY